MLTFNRLDIATSRTQWNSCFACDSQGVKLISRPARCHVFVAGCFTLSPFGDAGQRLGLGLQCGCSLRYAHVSQFGDGL